MRISLLQSLFLMIMFVLTSCNGVQANITPTLGMTTTPLPDSPIAIYAPGCDQMIEPTGISVSLSFLNAETSEIKQIKWLADRGSFVPDNVFISTYVPGAPGPILIKVRIEFHDGRTYEPSVNCSIVSSLFTATDIPATLTPTATVTFPPTPTFTPSLTITDTFTPEIPSATFSPIPSDTPTSTLTPETPPTQETNPTPETYLLDDCADSDLWVVDFQDQDEVDRYENGCSDFEYMHMYVGNGVRVLWPDDNQPQAPIAYNIYFGQRITAPTTIRFKMNIYEMKTRPQIGSDISLFAGFVYGSETTPNWVIGGEPPREAQGSFAIVRLAGTDVRTLANSSTKYLMYQTWLGDYDNVTKKFTADSFGIDFLLKYKNDGVDMFWKPELEEEFQLIKNDRDNGILHKPDPAFFVIGYILPKLSSLDAWITGLTITYGEE